MAQASLGEGVSREDLIAQVKAKRRQELIDQVKAKREAESANINDELGSGLQHALNTASFGYGPEILASLTPSSNKLRAAIQAPIGDIASAYEKAPEGEKSNEELIDEYRRNLEATKEMNPVSSTLGDVAGIFTGAGALSKGVGAATKGLQALKTAVGLAETAPVITNVATKAVPLAQKIWQGAKAGAGYGALQGAIQNTEDSSAPTENRLANAAIGGLTGGIGGAVLPALGHGLLKGSSFLKDKAEKLAFKALGPYAREVMKSASKDEINTIGRTLLDEGIVSGSPKSYETLGKELASKVDDVGSKIGTFIEGLSQKEQELLSQGFEGGIQRKDFAKYLWDSLRLPKTVAGGKESNQKFINYIRYFVRGQNPEMTIKEAQELKEILGENIKWDRLPGADIPIDEQFNRALYTKIKEGIENAVEALAKESGADDLAKYLNMKKLYGIFQKSKDIVEKRANKEFANRFLSPSDYMIGGAGIIGGLAGEGDLETKLKNAALYGSLGFGNKFLRERGNQMLSKGFDTLSKSYSGGGNILQNINPSLSSAFLNKIKNTLTNYEKTKHTIIPQKQAAEMWQNSN